LRVQIVDPSAYTAPYDRALCAALARAGTDVELVTSRFEYGPPPPAEGFAVNEFFYRHARGPAGSRRRRVLKLAEHIPDMLRWRRYARAADLVHLQWLVVEALDARLLPHGVPLVLTAHNALRESLSAGYRHALARADAVVVHSERARAAVSETAGLDPGRVHTIPHGAFDYLTRLPEERPLLPELAQVDGPVVLCFGLIRPYKGLDVLLEAWRGIDAAELWVVGPPRMDIEPLRASAPPGVRFVPRFIPDAEVPAVMRRADLVVLPYRAVDQSGALFAALAFGRPLLLTDVGGFPEVAARGAARLVPAESPSALHDELVSLIADAPAREAMAAAALAAAEGPYSWDAIGRRTLELYRELAR
jgi:glycosyltransferase involved in cell wall biosynthesis